MNRVGYLLNAREGLEGEPGFFYNYIVAGNGLFIRAQGSLIEATVQIAPAIVRGLAPVRQSVRLTYGKVPWHIYDLAVSLFAAEPRREHYLAVVWDRGYRLRIPPQERDSASVSYERLPHTVLDIHSHSLMSAFFSGTDNRDEQGLRLYMVVGGLDTMFPETRLRVGIYGYYAPLELPEVFGVQAGQ